ncbi:MAG: PASTA domain-containing protein, partial [Oscillospiraceae bacterium]|nr:PASTA domain-containing protein [Oscillospiraceae bacterium]
KDGTIKVMDFGIARFARSETMTVSDKTIGSVHYISPEQARGGQVTDKADIYSLGVMMFEMLTGTLPFVADSPVSVALKQIQDIPKKPRDINPDIPLGLEQITLKAMQKDASRRYQSAAEMLKDLVEFKRNPNLTFGYKYSKIKENTRMFEPIDDKKLNEYYEEDYEEQVRKSPVLAILSGVGAGFVIAALFFVGYIFLVNNPFKPVEDIQVPYLIGSTYEEARSNPENSGLRLVIERAYNAEYGEGVIFAQEPSAGRTIKASNPVVKIKVSRGMEYSEVPDVVDLDIYVAIARIKDAGLTYIEVPMTDDFVAENSVIKTSPPAKTKLPKGTSVTVYVSRGEEKKYTDVPDVVGLNINDAIKIIEDKNLVVGAVSRTSSDKPYNTVIAQDPTDSLQIMEGDIINLVISYDMTSLRKLVLPVELPNIDRTLKIEALADGITMGAEYLNPVQDISTWKPTIEGSGVVSVRIEIDDVLYKVIALDFDNNTYWEEEDHSEDLMEQLSNKTDEQDEIIDETEN